MQTRYCVMHGRSCDKPDVNVRIDQAYIDANAPIVKEQLQKAGVTINRPPRDGHMAFIRTPDNISIELIQKGEPKAPAEPWASAANIGVW